MNLRRVLFAAALTPAAYLPAKTIADYDHSVDLGKYRTYSWIGVSVEELLWKDRVSNAIDNELNAKGRRRVERGGEATISVLGSIHTEGTFETWYSGGFGAGWYHQGWWVGRSPRFAMTSIQRTPVGTLHIATFDAQFKKVI